jgi:hypothetical protein
LLAAFAANEQRGKNPLLPAVLSAIATARTTRLLAAHTALPDALDAGFHQALLAASIFLLAAAVIALRTRAWLSHSSTRMVMTARPRAAGS